MDGELIELFSTRRRAISQRLAEMADAYRDRYGIDPPAAVLSSMAQHATLITRPAKRDIDAAAALDSWEQAAREQGRALADLPRRVLGRRPASPDTGTAPADDTSVAAVLDRLAASGRATFTRHDLLRAALDVLPPEERRPEALRGEAERLAERAIASTELLTVTAPDPIGVPDALRRRDGTSVYEQPQRQRWTLRTTLDQERWLLDVAAEPTRRSVPERALEEAIMAHDLSDDQAGAVRELLADDRRVGLLIGPAGAGKTRTLRAVVDAWAQTHGSVIGLTVSQAAANVLAAEAEVRAENTTKWLYEMRRGRWHLPSGALVLIDEASMVATSDLVDLVEQARRAGGKVLLVGDPAQLAAIHIGGAFDLLAERHGATRLREVRRFAQPWERDASLLLRRRDPAALAEYAMRDRIHAGTDRDIEMQLFDAWRADALSTGTDGRRRSVLMIVATNEQAAVVSERARHALLAAGTVSDGPTAQLRDNAASVADHIVTRRNDRRLRTSNGGWVVNGDVWTVLTVHPDGALDARRHSDGSTITLTADYLAHHAHLAYATTAHRAQGMTVDVCHAAITADASHEQLYVAATRGRTANHLWVITDSDRDVVRDPDDLPAAEHVLARVLERRDPDRLSTHQTIADSLREMGSLARLGAIFEDAARTATDQLLRQQLSRHGLADAAGGPQWRTLVARVRQAALAGYDVAALVDEAIHLRAMDDADSTAAVIHWRIGVLTDNTTPLRHRGPLASLPPTEGPAIEVARQTGELIRRRWRDLRTALAVTTQALPWAEALGPRPIEPDEASAWLTAATAITAYRERYELPEHTDMLEERPPASRADARAAWDHARLQADRYLSRRLRDLDDDQLTKLDARMAAAIEARPVFDPSELEAARRDLSAIERLSAMPAGTAISDQRRRLRRRVETLEHARLSHADWRRRAHEAAATRRRVELERRQRSTSRRPLHRTA
ncbi:MAG: AAA family ATPase [Actinobacteria bacterium]|nr:AAA family ATPase [Actinomycetota bacterium]